MLKGFASLIILIIPFIPIVTHAKQHTVCFTDVQMAYQQLLIDENNKKDAKKSIASTETTTQVNINTAIEAELVTLKGIGSKKAQAVILYRDTMGQFDSVDDLAKVKGIGKKTVDKNRHRLTY